MRKNNYFFKYKPESTLYRIFQKLSSDIFFLVFD